ncbi:MAG: hypothetical protein ACRENE_31625 [Polyangiaceae bacterium]
MQYAEEQRPIGITHTYAEPLWGLRVSWGSVLAGAVATVAVALILWSLAFAIVSLGLGPSESSMRASATALWICAMVATLVGALVGGYLAGYLPGNAKPPIAAAHGFLSWCVAFLATFFVAVTLVRSAATMAAIGARPTVSATSLTSSDPPRSPGVQDPAGATPDPYSRNPSRNPEHDAAVDSMLKDSMVGMSWSWFGTWIVALGCAVGAASLGGRRLLAIDRNPELLRR